MDHGWVMITISNNDETGNVNLTLLQVYHTYSQATFE